MSYIVETHIFVARRGSVYHFLARNAQLEEAVRGLSPSDQAGTKQQIAQMDSDAVRSDYSCQL